MADSERNKALLGLALGTVLVLPGVVEVMLVKALGPVGYLLRWLWR